MMPPTLYVFQLVSASLGALAFGKCLHLVRELPVLPSEDLSEDSLSGKDTLFHALASFLQLETSLAL